MKKWIPGYEGLYEISDDGVVYRHTKTQIKAYSGNQHPTGYLKVALCKEGKAKTYNVHRLVAEAFIPKEEGKDIVDHIDEDKTNNKVDNLRWCTVQENNEYYDTKDGRRYQKEQMKKYKQQLKTYEKQLQAKVKELNRVKKELEVKEKELCGMSDKLEQQQKELLEYKVKAKEYLANALSADKNKYDGYLDTKGVSFKSVDEMVDIVGKPIEVDGKEFKSCGAAAAYIVAEELEKGIIRNKATISKELRRYLQGLRPSWSMYNKYQIK